MTRLPGRPPVPLSRLYRTMVRIRRFEEALGELWAQGRISGEMHLGIGEEGAVAGVVDHLRDGDSMSLDHRSTPPLVARGTPIESMTLEMLGHPGGLCAGQGGHMHMFDPERSAASSGIVGAAGPAACGFAMAHQQRGEGRVAVAFFGEGAANQGMLLESWNLAVAWRLPVVFVCKDNGWAITTRSARQTGGRLTWRARSFGMPASAHDGARPWSVWQGARVAVARARRGRGPSLLVVRVRRPHGHFEDDPLVRMAGDPEEVAAETSELLRRVREPGGGSPGRRVAGVIEVARTLGTAMTQHVGPARDPLELTERRLGREADAIRGEAEREVDDAVAAALAGFGDGP